MLNLSTQGCTFDMTRPCHPACMQRIQHIGDGYGQVQCSDVLTANLLWYTWVGIS